MEDELVDVLLIEDNAHDAEMTIRALKKNRIANGIVHMNNGVLALEYLFGSGVYSGRNVNNKPKLILLDLKMPKVDGIEVLEKIKANENTRKIPVVVLTSSNENPDIDTCYTLGANSYIVKPVDFNNFMDAIAHSGIYWMHFNQPPN